MNHICDCGKSYADLAGVEACQIGNHGQSAPIRSIDLATGVEVGSADYEWLLDDKREDIRQLVGVIREIYAIAGEFDDVSRLCNSVLEQPKFEGY